jgi:hypothetical protein
MTNDGVIDTSFDARSDSRGQDPDAYSATLRRFHRRLWSKPLPSGALFDLDENLHHKSDLGEFELSSYRAIELSSDSIVHTYRDRWLEGPLADGIARIPEEDREYFYNLAHTVGGYLVFPCNPISAEDGKPQLTINQARGWHRRIGDRFDLTLECIRRHYNGEDSPLSDVLARYADFFALFDNFRGYVDHFLLNDLVSDDYQSVKFVKEFDDGFPVRGALPDGSAGQYREYMTRCIDFVNARNERIAAVRFDNSGS